MGLRIPNDVKDFLRDVFSQCNFAATKKLSTNPNVPEQYLDVSLIEILTAHASPMRLNSGWTVRIETHYLGGLRHVQNWEIADIGILLSVRSVYQPRVMKVALLQSKRLYPENSQVKELLSVDFEIGIGRLLDPEDDQPFHARLNPTTFNFEPRSRYQQLPAKDHQYKLIEKYETENKLKVYYSLYNPWTIPFRTVIPVESFRAPDGPCTAGIRIIPSSTLRSTLKNRKVGYSLSYDDVRACHNDGGWRLEEFIADYFLECTEGDVFTSRQDERIYSLFNRRSGPIAASIAINLESPE